ncbi:MAG: hypothetical protein EPO32_05000 [Anaerolineae bacterium]|nr:MAG: hypothetical protein EPO32_05000 [Anaerolineae bacterium]
MPTNQGVDLLKLFSSVTQTLEQNRGTLNQADSGNGNHGDNMVEIFEVITKAMQTRQNSDPADQLAYAAKLLSAKPSGSAQVYAKGLGEAAQQVQGQQSLDPGAAVQLVQTLLSGGQAPAAATSGGQDPLMGLLGGLLGGGQQQVQSGDAGLDAGDLLNAGMAFLDARNSGDTTTEAAVKALLSASPLGQSPHRQQSGQLVASTLLDMLAKINAGKK